MKRKMTWPLMVLVVVLLAGGAGAEEKNGQPLTKNKGEEIGPTPAVLTSTNIKLELHSSIHFDYIGFDKDEKSIDKVKGSLENNVFARRARLVLRGRLFDNVGFYLQMAFDAPLTPFLIDAQVSMPFAPFLDFTAGLMKMPFSEERLKSYATRQPFMERSSVSNLELRRSQGAQLRFHLPDSDAVSVYVGVFTGENLVTANTDDEFEYVTRLALRLDQMFDGFPGAANLAGSYARGKRVPENFTAVQSFAGKTLNEFVFFQAVPVNGFRTRFELDADWRYGPFMAGGEYIKSIEQRDEVEINLMTAAGPVLKVVRDLEPLEATGWNAYVVWVLSGEEAKTMIEPANEWGAVSLVARYSTVTFDAGDHRIPSTTPGVHGHEFNDTSKALGRKNIDDTMRDLYVGVNYDLKTGVFFQFAAIWQWWDSSSPFVNDPDKHADVNYRARVGVTF